MEKKRIGIDARLYFQTGVGTYLRNFLHYLPEKALPQMQFYLYALPGDGEKITVPSDRFIIRPVDARWHSLREQTVFYDTLMEDNLDLMHFTYFSYPVRYNRPFIATVHDLTPLLFKTGRASTLPSFFYELKYQVFRYVLSQQIKHACQIITPTQTVKHQIIQEFGPSVDDKIIPIPEGINYELREAQENTSLKNNYHGPFYLAVGNMYPHKNMDRLVEAFRLSHCPYHLIIICPENTFAEELQQKITDMHIEHIHFVHDASAADMVFFYKHARAYVNPSLSEGFGLPLLEAAYFGCPVIASDIPVFHELLDREYTAFDPMNVDDIVEKLRVMSSESRNQRSVIVDKAKDLISRQFSFEKMTTDVVRLYNDI